MKPTHYSRRRWLKTMGLGAAAPLLMPFANRVAAQDMGHVPKRFVIVLAGNGIESKTLLSPLTQAALEASSTTSFADLRFNFFRNYTHSSPIVTADAALGEALALSSLSGSGDQLDLTNKAAVIYGLSNKVAGGGHSAGYGALSAASGGGSNPTGISIDAWLANVLMQQHDTAFDAVRLGVSPSLTQKLQYGACGFAARQPAPVIVDPKAAYSSLFGVIASAESQREFTDRTDLLTFASADVERALSIFSGSSRERAKLERYLESVQALSRRQTRLIASQERLNGLSPISPQSEPRFDSIHPLERLAVQFELATTALIGDLTSVAVLTSGVKEFDMTYSSLESTFREDPNYRGLVGRHTVCHESGDNPAYVNVLNRVTERTVEMIAKMARALAAVPEGDGTMLDNTAILLMPDNGDQHHSPGAEYPALMLGGQSLGLKTDGRSVVYPAEGASGHRQLSNLFNTLGWAAGEELNDFGGEGATRIQAGPLSELFD